MASNGYCLACGRIGKLEGGLCSQCRIDELTRKGGKQVPEDEELPLPLSAHMVGPFNLGDDRTALTGSDAFLKMTRR